LLRFRHPLADLFLDLRDRDLFEGTEEEGDLELETDATGLELKRSLQRHALHTKAHISARIAHPRGARRVFSEALLISLPCLQGGFFGELLIQPVLYDMPHPLQLHGSKVGGYRLSLPRASGDSCILRSFCAAESRSA